MSKIILAGGTEAPLCRLCFEGYGRAGALSKRTGASASRPFDATRDGFVLAEGACVLVLEEYHSALERGAPLYGEVIGYSSTSDAFHITRPDPAGEAYALASALSEAGIQPEEITYINAHGTSTPLGDRAEAAAIREIFGKRAQDVPVSAIKSMTGHMLAASGAFEVACTLMSMKHGVIPPTLNLNDRDPDCNLNVVPERKEVSIAHALSSSFGFGGVNAVIVLKSVNR
jgi:3-oxoacyl-[acyl-carrier-protein] synthase II